MTSKGPNYLPLRNFLYYRIVVKRDVIYGSVFSFQGKKLKTTFETLYTYGLLF